MTTVPPDAVGRELLESLPASPDAYPQKLDLNAGRVLIVRLDAATYRAASFLDDRILGPAVRGAWLSLGDVIEASRRIAERRRVHFILHTGHVGSTLVSRLLDETGLVLSLREPLPLRTLADVHDVLGRVDSLWSEPQFDLVVGAFMRLWSRGYHDTQCVVVKATSSAGRVHAALLAASEDSRAIYMNLRAEPYLATLLAGQNSLIDLRGHGPERMRRVQARFGASVAPLHALSVGELAALSWLAETSAQRDALKALPGRVIDVDFDTLLGDVAGQMARILEHFALPDAGRHSAQMARSASLSRYSKAPEYDYSADARAEVLRESRRSNRLEIRKGLEWLEALAKSNREVAEIVGHAGA